MLSALKRGSLALLVLTTLSAAPSPASAKALARPLPQTPGEVIAIINDYRAQNGLPAYQQNDILMQIAQGQADYLASQGQSNDVHAGPGGSRPKDRAYAAGYGGGQQFFLSEIGKYGLGETPQSAVNWWKQSPDHNPTMVASTYIETGCGVATDGNGRYYYICDMGYVVGGTYTPSGGSSTGQQPAAPVMIPVTKADPQPDGSIVHIIRTGQTLWTLAAVYEVPLQQILDLNHYSESQIIHPGDEVMVAGPGSAVPPTPTPTETEPSPTATSTQEAEPTHTPRPTSEVGGGLVATTRPTEERQLVQSDPAALEKAAQQNSTVKLVVGLSLAGILGVIAASFLIQKPRPPEPPEDDPFAPIN
jgi:uncharacterized protein YkwD